MDIVAIIPDRIYSIIYDGEDTAEYYRLFNEEWTDVDSLMDFFQSTRNLQRMISGVSLAMILK